MPPLPEPEQRRGAEAWGEIAETWLSDERDPISIVPLRALYKPLRLCV
jgi:hypothetical protein